MSVRGLLDGNAVHTRIPVAIDQQAFLRTNNRELNFCIRPTTDSKRCTNAYNRIQLVISRLRIGTG